MPLTRSSPVGTSTAASRCRSVRAVCKPLFSDHAEIYTEHSTHSGPNAYYDRPAILRLAGELAGLRVLELGCAGGVLTEMLIDRGADVTALDREPRLVGLAQQRIGQRGRAAVADLEKPLDMIPSASVDLVIASLVLHYIADWRPLLSGWIGVSSRAARSSSRFTTRSRGGDCRTRSTTTGRS